MLRSSQSYSLRTTHRYCINLYETISYTNFDNYTKNKKYTRNISVKFFIPINSVNDIKQMSFNLFEKVQARQYIFVYLYAKENEPNRK